MRLLPLLGGLLPLLGLVGAAPSCNHECNRACWTSRLNINTDYENEWPDTGVTRIFDLEITEVDEWFSPGGHNKKGAMLINDGYPGQLIKADWGDRIEVTVTNRLKFNGTSMYWHGFHQLNSNNQDGVAGVTKIDTLAVTLDVTEVNKGISKVLWAVDGSAIDVQWEKPTLEYVIEGNFTFPREANIIKLPEASKWSFWVIQNNSPSPHPMHLQGHDFLILGRSRFTANPLVDPGRPILFDPVVDGPHLKFDDPTWRNTMVLPPFGWLVIAFEAGKNPGSWVFHCHVPWHMSQGLSVQFLERVDRINWVIPNLMPDLRMKCDDWRDYANNNPGFKMRKIDSGI